MTGPLAAGRPETGIRLQKVLAAAGLGSRRACEQLIADGRVTIDGVASVELGARVDPATDVIRVDGKRINVRTDLVYLALNKPAGMVTAMTDPHGRACVGDLLTDRADRLFHVGRLDADTEGLLILTNDGEFANRLAHPSYRMIKTYVAEVDGPVSNRLRATMLAGVQLDDGPVVVDDFRVLDTNGGRALVEVSLHEGRNRIVRRLLDSLGHPVRALVRTSVGVVRLGELKTGTLRELTAAELAGLYSQLGL